MVADDAERVLAERRRLRVAIEEEYRHSVEEARAAAEADYRAWTIASSGYGATQ